MEICFGRKSPPRSPRVGHPSGMTTWPQTALCWLAHRKEAVSPLSGHAPCTAQGSFNLCLFVLAKLRRAPSFLPTWLLASGKIKSHSNSSTAGLSHDTISDSCCFLSDIHSRVHDTVFTHAYCTLAVSEYFLWPHFNMLFQNITELHINIKFKYISI